MIGAVYTSDQRIVDIYKDVSTLSENKGEKIPPEKVLAYIDIISSNNKYLMNFKPIKLLRAS